MTRPLIDRRALLAGASAAMLLPLWPARAQERAIMPFAYRATDAALADLKTRSARALRRRVAPLFSNIPIPMK